ncbi:hypothetical protein [Clostridium botulinum]|nr:hypothetical protein [Clostridium botulinum]MCD3203075.1 hypothetical protein [Clostridium botulinum C/D]MCD3222759.1 hypothetical protein [Clostridium botulinum C/D]MCD3230956.1 hypothetical protein [Clostridium botulinum C/D]MCD3253267.1 hypothetical protein [Clostridium botulinum C/D]MCD3273533.1 hypothetical protein [Clostridium botulinum C/D]
MEGSCQCLTPSAFAWSDIKKKNKIRIMKGQLRLNMKKLKKVTIITKA